MDLEVDDRLVCLVQVGGSSFPFPLLSFLRKQESSPPACVWIPACAGMTVWKAASSTSGRGLLPQCTSGFPWGVLIVIRAADRGDETARVGKPGGHRSTQVERILVES